METDGEFSGIEVELEEEEEEELEPLEVWIEKIDQSGLMETRWSVPVLTFANFTNVSTCDYRILLEMNSDEEDQTEEFKYNITKFMPSLLLTQLTFSKPLEISQGSVFDRVHVWMKRELFMIRDEWEIWKTWKDPNEDIEEEIDLLLGITNETLH